MVVGPLAAGWGAAHTSLGRITHGSPESIVMDTDQLAEWGMDVLERSFLHYLVFGMGFFDAEAPRAQP